MAGGSHLFRTLGEMEMALRAAVAGRLVLVILLTAPSASMAADPPNAPAKGNPQGVDPTADRPRVELERERDRLSAEVARVQQAGDAAQVISLSEQLLAVERKLDPQPSAKVAETLNRLGGAELQRDNFSKAEAYYQEALAIQKKLLGDKHWKVTDARISYEGARRIGQFNAGERQSYREAGNANAAMQRLKSESKPADALVESQKCHEGMRQLFGDKHPYYAWCLKDHALLLHNLGKYSEAEKLYREVISVRQQALGELHPEYAGDLVSLAVLMKDQGRSPQAVPLLEQALKIQRQTSGEDDPMYASTLDHLGTVFRRMGDYGRAKSLYQQALELNRKRVGESHPDYAYSIENLGSLLQAMGDFAQAEPLLKQSLKISKETDGEGTSEYATSMFNLAQLYREMNDLDQAEALFREAGSTYRKVLGETHPWYARSLESSADVARARADFAEAERLLQEVVQIRRSSLGEAHPEFALSVQRLAELYLTQGSYARSEPLWEQALAIEKKALGDSHPFVASCLSGMAQLYHSKGDHSRAEGLYLQALEIKKQTLGESHTEYAHELNNLAELYKHMARPKQAEPLYLKSLEIVKHRLGTKHPDYARTLNNLAQLAAALGEFDRAERTYLESIEIMKQAVGERHPDFATGLDSLASLYVTTGNYARAEELFLQAIDIDKKVLGESHPKYADCLNNLAHLYSQKGDYARAVPLFRQAIEAKRRALGEAHPDYATSLGNLALLYENMRDFANAEPLSKRVLEIKKAAFGENHLGCALALNNLASLYHSMGESLRAEPLYRQELEIQRKSLGNDHPNCAATLNSLAVVYMSIGDWQRAEPLFRESLKIREKTLGANHALCGSTLSNLAEVCKRRYEFAEAQAMLERAVKIIRSTLGESNSSLCVALNNLSWAEFALDRTTDAERHMHDALRISRRDLDLTAAVQSERQQLAMSEHTRAYLDGYLTTALAAKTAPEELYAEVASWKGSIAAQQQLVRARQRSAVADPDSELGRLFAELEDKTRKLAGLYSYSPKPNEKDSYDESTRTLSESIEDLQQRLSKIDGEFHRLWAERKLSADELRQSLPADVALVDLLAYSQFRLATKAGEFESWQRRYLAFVLRRDQPVAVVELGPADPIDNLIDQWRSGYGELSTRDGKAPGDELRRLVWQPIAAKLGDTRVTLISPDSAFARLAWAALPGEKPGSYLIEERAIALVPIPQRLPEMLAEPPARSDQPSLLLAGDVNFGAEQAATAGSQSRAAEIRGHRVIWPPLAGTRVEIDEVQAIFSRAFGNATPKLLIAELATEDAFRRDAGKHRFLHVATHGYFASLDGTSTVPVDDSARAAKPAADTPGRVGIYVEMRDGRCIVTQVAEGAAAELDGRIRVGDELLAVASGADEWFDVSGQAVAAVLGKLRGPTGSTARLKMRLTAKPDEDAMISLVRTPMPAQAPGGNSLSGLHPGLLSGIVLAGANRPPDPESDDGILTAFEVSELNLENVELVTLSACETGLGQSAAGEGVLGLQRAFQTAGARSAISGLWKVPDRATQMLMVRFYDNLWQKQMSKLAALREAQLWMLREVPKHPELLSEAQRGLDLDPSKEQPRKPAGLSARAWAGFVLSGDWR